MSFKWIWINSINICIEYLLRMWRKLHKVAYLKGKRHEHHLDLHLFRMYFYFFCLHILNLVHLWLLFCVITADFTAIPSSLFWLHPKVFSTPPPHPSIYISLLILLVFFHHSCSSSLSFCGHTSFLPPFLIHPTASLAWPTVTICLPAFVSLNFQELIWRKCSFLNITSHPLSCSLTVSLKSIYILLHIT